MKNRFFIFLACIIFLGGALFFWFVYPNDAVAPSRTVDTVNTVPIVEEVVRDPAVADYFLTFIADQIPEYHDVTAGTYIPSPRVAPIENVQIASPCSLLPPTGVVPLECDVSLEFWMSDRRAASIQDYLASELFFDTYEGIYAEQFSRQVTDAGTLVYTPTFFNCFGTGAESCLQKQYAFFFPNGEVGRARISYWPYDSDGERLTTLPSYIANILDFYERILLSL